MADVENVGGIGISLEIDDKTSGQINEIEASLNELVKPRKILLEVSAPSLDQFQNKLAALEGRGAPAKGGPSSTTQQGVDERVVASLKTGIDRFTAALADVKVAIDPASITALTRAIKQAMSGEEMAPASGMPQKLYRGGGAGYGAAAAGYQVAPARAVTDGMTAFIRGPAYLTRTVQAGVLVDQRISARFGGEQTRASAGGGGRRPAQQVGIAEVRTAVPAAKPAPRVTYAERVAKGRLSLEEAKKGPAGGIFQTPQGEPVSREEQLETVRQMRAWAQNELGQLNRRQLRNPSVKPFVALLQDVLGFTEQAPGRIEANWATEEPTQPPRPRSARTRKPRLAPAASIAAETTAAATATTTANVVRPRRRRIDTRTWLPEEERGLDAEQRRALIERDRAEREQQDLGVVEGFPLHARIQRRVGPDRPRLGGGSRTARLGQEFAARRREAESRAALGLTPTPVYRRTLPTGRLGETPEATWRMASAWDPSGARGAAPRELAAHEQVLMDILGQVQSGELHGGFRFTEPSEAAKRFKKIGRPLGPERARLATIPADELHDFVQKHGLMGQEFNLPDEFESFSGLRVRPVSRTEVVRQELMDRLGANWDALMQSPRMRSILEGYLKEIQYTKVRLGRPESGKVWGSNVPIYGRNEPTMIPAKSRGRRRETLYARRGRARIGREAGYQRATSEELRAREVPVTEADRAAVQRWRLEARAGRIPSLETGISREGEEGRLEVSTWLDEELRDVQAAMQEFSRGDISYDDYKKRIGTYDWRQGGTYKRGVRQRLQLPLRKGGRGFGRGPHLRLPAFLQGIISDAASFGSSIYRQRAAEQGPKDVAAERRDFPAVGIKRSPYSMFEDEAITSNITTAPGATRIQQLLRRLAFNKAAAATAANYASWHEKYGNVAPGNQDVEQAIPKIRTQGYRDPRGNRVVPPGAQKSNWPRVLTETAITPTAQDIGAIVTPLPGGLEDITLSPMSDEEILAGLQEEYTKLANLQDEDFAKESPAAKARMLLERDLARETLGLPINKQKRQENLARTNARAAAAPAAAATESAAPTPAAAGGAEAPPPTEPVPAAAGGGGGGGGRRATRGGTTGPDPRSYMRSDGVIRVFVVDGKIKVYGERATTTASSEGAGSRGGTSRTRITPEEQAKRNALRGMRDYEKAMVPPALRSERQEMYERLWNRMEREERAAARAQPQAAPLSFQDQLKKNLARIQATVPPRGAYYPAANAAENISAFQGGQGDAVLRQMALQETLRPLGMSPADLEPDAWGRRAAELKGRRPNLTTGQVRSRIREQVKRRLVQSGIRSEWTPEDINEFMDDAMRVSGLEQPAGTRGTRGTTTGRGPSREGTTVQRLSKALQQMGIAPPAATPRTGTQIPTGRNRRLGIPNALTNPETGEEIGVNPYEYLAAETAAAQSQQRELGLRALSTMAIQWTGTKFGPYERIRGRMLDVERKRRTAAGAADVLGERMEERAAFAPKVLEARRRAQQAGATPEQLEAYTVVRREFVALGKATGTQTRVVKDSIKAHEQAARSVVTAGDTIQHFGASFAGGIAGGFIGAMAGMIAQPLIQAVGVAVEKIGGPLVDQALGFTMTRQRTMGELAAATAQQGGLAAQAFAGQYLNVPTVATEPLAGAAISQAETIAAAKQFESFRDLFRTVRGMPQGLAGFSPALTSTQGPLGNPLLADYKSITELISSEFHPYMGKMTPGQPRSRYPGTQVNEADQQWVDQLNAMIAYGSKTPEGKAAPYRIAPVPAGESAEQEAARRQEMAAAGLSAVSAAGYAVVDMFGNVVTEGKKLAEAANYVGKSFTRINPDQYIEQNRPQWRAQMEGAALQTQLQIDTINPIQRYMDYITNPPLPFGTGVMPDLTGAAAKFMPAMGYDAQKGMGKFPGVDATTLQSYKSLQAAANESRSAIKQMAAEGRAALERLNVPTAVIDRIASIGEEIAAAQTKIGGIQANLNWTRYNHDLTIAQRGVTDMLQLTGKLGKTSGDNVGYYERELLLINRQSTALSLQLQQRQIMTQLALAQFSVPGETGEERYARRYEKEIEAGIAQKQLDLSKKAFGIEIQLVDAQNLRGLQDAIYAVQDLQRGWNAQNEIALLQDFINTKQREMQMLIPDASAWISLKTGYESMMIEIAQDLAARTDEAVADVLGKKIRPAVEALLSAIPRALLTGRGGGGGSWNQDGSSNDGRSRGTNRQDYIVPRAIGPQDEAIWGARLGIKPRTSAGLPPVDAAANTGYMLRATTTSVTNTVHNEKIEIKPVFEITTPSLDEEQVRDLTNHVVKSINTALSLVGLRPVAS